MVSGQWSEYATHTMYFNTDLSIRTNKFIGIWISGLQKFDYLDDTMKVLGLILGTDVVFDKFAYTKASICMWTVYRLMNLIFPK